MADSTPTPPSLQPNFTILEASLQSSVREISRIKNIPALDAGNALHERLTEILERFDIVDQRFDAIDQRFDAIDQRFDAIDQRFDAVDERFDSLDQRLDASDFNITARLTNGNRGRNPSTELVPLRNSANEPVQGFPRNLAALNRLTRAQLDILLGTYGLPTAGSVAARRRLFTEFIGVVVTSP